MCVGRWRNHSYLSITAFFSHFTVGSLCALCKRNRTCISRRIRCNFVFIFFFYLVQFPVFCNRMKVINNCNMCTCIHRISRYIENKMIRKHTVRRPLYCVIEFCEFFIKCWFCHLAMTTVYKHLNVFVATLFTKM